MLQKTILLVEDNPDDEELALIALRNNPLISEVVVAHDGVEALDYLFGTGAFRGRTRFEYPQLILMDLKLPKLNGLEVLQRLRANVNTVYIPVVILTSSSEEEDIIASYRLGANSYVRKPVGFHRFAEAVRHLGTYWLSINELVPGLQQ